MDLSLSKNNTNNNRHRRRESASSLAYRTSTSTSSTNTSNSNDPTAAQAAQSSLQLLLREDVLLRQCNLTELGEVTEGGGGGGAASAFSYASALLEENSSMGGLLSLKNKADAALADTERKLALVESLAVKLSRTRPEAVAGHLLRLHGYEIEQDEGAAGTSTAAAAGSTTTVTLQPPGLTSKESKATLASIRDKADRLERQADVLENVAKRVETSMARGMSRMESACQRLERVLLLSSTLKSILRLQFESSKLMNYDLEDSRDLTRAAASVAILEELLKQPELQAGIHVVERMRPQIEKTARQVRLAAETMLQEQYSQPTALMQLGATFQVYFHLGELPDAVWRAVDHAHAKAESLSRSIFNAVNFVNLADQAKRTAKEARLIQKKLKQVRAEAAREWGKGMTDVVLQVRHMQRVLSGKTDPVSRRLFVDVVSAAPIPAAYAEGAPRDRSSIFSLFWGRMCRSLSTILDSVLKQDSGKYFGDAAALYPPVRAVTIELIGRLQETLPGSSLEESGSGPTVGILGGSQMLDDEFLRPTGRTKEQRRISGENPQAAADTWTRVSNAGVMAQPTSTHFLSMGSTVPVSLVFQSAEWKAIEGHEKTQHGFYPLQQAFIKSCTERLCSPLQYMFPENVTVDDDGVAVATGLALLPSKYDVQRFDENIRQELSYADPREAGGDLTAVSMIAACIVTMISQFCDCARKALSGAGENGYLQCDWEMTESLQHDRKVAAIMFSMAKYLRSAPEKTYILPYRPTTLPQHEEAAAMCHTALAPALIDIEKMVRSMILNPLCRAINRRISRVLSKMHHGVYIQSSRGGMEDESPAFVQKYLSEVFEAIGQYHLARFPPEYAYYLASKVATYSVYAFVSNASLVRPLGENARLNLTQDLADLELLLDQLVGKIGGNQSLSLIDGGKPYAELRAVRHMLFWTGLENESASPQDIGRSLLREAWIKDVRRSTVLHYLFSFAPSLLSSPHHAKNMKADDYVALLVKLDGSLQEDDAWFTTIACCDSYQQRASSVSSGIADGDPRVAQILMAVGQELLRRRQG